MFVLSGRSIVSTGPDGTVHCKSQKKEVTQRMLLDHPHIQFNYLSHAGFHCDEIQSNTLMWYAQNVQQYHKGNHSEVIIFTTWPLTQSSRVRGFQLTSSYFSLSLISLDAYMDAVFLAWLDLTLHPQEIILKSNKVQLTFCICALVSIWRKLNIIKVSVPRIFDRFSFLDASS